MRQCCVVLLLTFLMFAGLCCKDEPTAPYDITFILTEEDISCTEAWLKLRIRVGSASREVILEIINRGLYETIYKNIF